LGIVPFAPLRVTRRVRAFLLALRPRGQSAFAHLLYVKEVSDQ
jgi:hypothetical protein